ncbi:hypothetical protein FKM82_018338 [Ascaphus truei]
MDQPFNKDIVSDQSSHCLRSFCDADVGTVSAGIFVSSVASLPIRFFCFKPALTLRVLLLEKELSVALYSHLQQSTSEASDVPVDLRFLCCDIDSDLITRAQTSNPFPGAISYMALDIMDSSELPDPVHSFLDEFGRSTFDIGFCMSVTMWIHLHHGDQGLVTFLCRLASLCNYLLIEPQPWKCYRSAARRLRKLGRKDFEHFHTLSIRGDMTEKVTHILTSGGSAELIHSFGNTSWDRSLLLFKNTRSAKHSAI